MEFPVEAIYISIITFLINIPFGILRNKHNPYTIMWFVYIHLPIPLIFFMRHYTNISYLFIPLFVLTAMLGQFVGGRRY